MKAEHLQRLKKKAKSEGNPLLRDEFANLVAFIRKLRKRGIPLSHIETNDWSSNLSPGVYVKNKHNQFKTRRYVRCADKDVTRAWKFYNSKDAR